MADETVDDAVAAAEAAAAASTKAAAAANISASGLRLEALKLAVVTTDAPTCGIVAAAAAYYAFLAGEASNG